MKKPQTEPQTSTSTAIKTFLSISMVSRPPQFLYVTCASTIRFDLTAASLNKCCSLNNSEPSWDPHSFITHPWILGSIFPKGIGSKCCQMVTNALDYRRQRFSFPFNINLKWSQEVGHTQITEALFITECKESNLSSGRENYGTWKELGDREHGHVSR